MISGHTQFLLQPIGLLILAYLLGAIPFALLTCKLKGIDLRAVGSGNLGATNVYRAAGLPLAIFVFILDALKGFIPTYLALNISENPWTHIGIGAMAIIGHSLSPFVKFKGGKGAATGMGVLLAISPDVLGIIAIMAVLGISITRYVSLTTLICCIAAPILLVLLGYPNAYSYCVAVISLFVIWRHKPNIIRLINGQEHKI
jgi:acyl phosphate:glycerol-3-phosphate acyltransferase